MIWILDADLNGMDSIADVIGAGLVRHLPCATFIDFDKHYIELLKTIGPEDVVVLDTISKLADTTRGDMKLGVDPTEEYWGKKHLYLGGDKNYLTVYEAAGQFIMRRLRNLRARGCRIIVTCHEDEQIDPQTGQKLRAPAVNEALYRSLQGSSSDMFRLYMTREDVLNAQGAVQVPAYSRVLQLRPSEVATAKYHTARQVSDKVPRNLLNPTYPRMCEVLQKKPTWLTLYGEPGAGKTTFAVSEAVVTPNEKVKK